MSGLDPAVLRAVLDTIIPPDRDPGATDLGVDDFVLAILAQERTAEAPEIWAGLARLGPGFVGLDAAGRLARIEQVAAEPWFVLLAELAAEGYYADPGNGGNRGARSWAMVGYEPRLSEPLLGKRH